MRVPNLFLWTLFFVIIGCQNATESISKKNPKVQIWQTLVDGELQITRNIYYTYNNREELVEVLMVEVSDGKETPVNRTLKFYDSDGKETKIIRERWSDSSWIFSFQSTFSYENEKIASRLDSLAPYGNKKLFYIDYEYTSEGELKAEITKREIKNSLVNSLKINYQYDEYGSPIQKEFPVWKDDEWVNSRKMTLAYNDQQHHIQTIRYNWINDEWVENIRYDLTVDKDGNRLSEDWKRLEDTTYNTFTRVEYKYD